MSHFTRVRTEITDRDLLLEALRHMSLTVRENAPVRGWDGQTTEADLVAVQDSGFDIGFVRPSEGEPYQIVADWMGAGDQDEFTRQVKREYAAAGATRAAEQAGWRNIRRRYTDDGEIEILAERTR